MPSFYICTFGCRCNQADSAAIREGLRQKGHNEAAGHVGAELVVINTCTVTHRTDQQVRQMVRRVHRENPGARLVVTGCYAERDPDALAEMPGVSLTVGNADRDRLVQLLEQDAAAPGPKIVRSPLDERSSYLAVPQCEVGAKTRPLVKIQDGCDTRCAYCIVPSVRGPGRSAYPDQVVAAVEALVRKGYREIVLTGVNLGAYGTKLEGTPTLNELLQRIVEIPGLGRLRLSSIEPMRFAPGIVQLAASNTAIAPHFHVPLQSGSDRILRRMRRPYTAAAFLSLIDSIRQALPSAGIGTDVLVGFPGENDEDYRLTRDLVRRAPLTYLHVFPFSPREGTTAYSLAPRVPPAVIHERVSDLRSISQQKNLAFRRSQIGCVLPAITLAKEEGMGDSMALTANYIRARVAGAIDPNRMVMIRITEVADEETAASVVQRHRAGCSEGVG